MKDSERFSIPQREYRRRLRRVVASSAFCVALGTAYGLWGCYQSSKGIQPVDYVVAVLTAIVIAGCCYAGWRIAERRISDTHRDSPSQTASSRSATGDDSET